jgi:hypothetical protein
LGRQHFIDRMHVIDGKGHVGHLVPLIRTPASKKHTEAARC